MNELSHLSASPEDSPPPCPSEEMKARFFERRASADEKASIEAHLADCDACRLEAVAAWRRRSPSAHGVAADLAPAEVPPELLRRVEELVPRRPKIGSPRPRVAVKVWLPLAAMLFVATALFLIRPESGSAPSEDGTPVLRGGGVTAEAGTSPESGAVIPLAETPLLFRWPAASEGGRYRLVILDDVGQRVFHAETTELGQDVESAALGVGDFYWTLERIYPDGTTATERTRSFQIVGAQSVEGVPK